MSHVSYLLRTFSVLVCYIFRTFYVHFQPTYIEIIKMNKKITLYYFLIALIVIISITDSSYAALVSAKFDVDKTLAFWTPERIKSAKPLILKKNIGFRNKTRNATKNVTITADDNDQQRLSMPPFDNPKNPSNYPVGMLFYSIPGNEDIQYCTPV